jgi:hypothetical protein
MIIQIENSTIYSKNITVQLNYNLGYIFYLHTFNNNTNIKICTFNKNIYMKERKILKNENKIYKYIP